MSVTDLASVRWEHLLDGLQTAVVVVDLCDVVVAWNAAAERLYEIAAGAAVGCRFRDLDVSDRLAGLRARVEAVKAGTKAHGRARSARAGFASRSGDHNEADLRVSPLIDAHGAVVAVLIAGLDTTEPRRLEAEVAAITAQRARALEELQTTNAELESTVDELQAVNMELATLHAELERRTSELKRLAASHARVLESLEEPIVVLDRDFVVTTWTRATERCWDLRAERAVGRDFFSLPLGDVACRARDAVRTVAAIGERAVLRGVRYRGPDGRDRAGLLRLTPLFDVAGEPAGIVAVLLPADAAPAACGRAA